MNLASPVPFTMKVSDYSQLEGVLHLEEGGIRLEFYHKETVLNVFGSSLKERPIDFERIADLQHKKGWFGDRLIIQFKSMSDADGIPGAKLGAVYLKTRKRDRDRVAELVVDGNYRMSELRFDALEARRAT